MRCVSFLCLLPLLALADLGPVRLMRVPNGGLQPQAVVDEKGTIHLLYYSGDPKQGDLFYVKSGDDGRTFSEPVRVNSEPGSAIAAGTIRGGQIAVGKNNRVHVAWNGALRVKPHGSPMLYARLNDSGTAFEPQRNLMTRTLHLDGGGSVAADRNGNVYVAWHGNGKGGSEDEADRQVWLARSTDDGKSFAPETPAWQQRTGACACCGMGIYATRSGSVFALYRSAIENVHRDMYVLVSTDRARTFNGRMIHKWEINACPMSSMSFAESGDAVFGAWETGGQVYFSDIAATSTAIPAPSTGKNRKHPRLASGGKRTLLVWTEGTGWQRGGSLAWQVFEANGKPTDISGQQSGIPAWSFAAPVRSRDNTFVIFY